MLSPSSGVCAVCETPFTVKLRGKRRIYCSGACRNKAHYPTSAKAERHVAIGTEFSCKHCGQAFAKSQKRQRYCLPCSTLSTANKLPASREWNRNYQREYQKRRRQESVAAAINSRMSAHIRLSLQDGKNGRSWESLVGYKVAELMLHLERQFVDGMNWGNRSSWHIDHIVPLNSFVFDSAQHEQFKSAWALTNLRPLWATENIRKSDNRTHLL